MEEKVELFSYLGEGSDERSPTSFRYLTGKRLSKPVRLLSEAVPLMGAGSRQLPGPNSEDQGGTGVKASAQSEGATNKDTDPRDTALPRPQTIIIAPEREP